MRRFRAVVFVQALFLLFLFWNAPFVSADTSIIGKTDCPSGSNANPTGSQSFSAGGSNVSGAVKAYLYQVESCASACFNEQVDVTFSFTLTLTVKTTATNQCKSDPTGQNPKPDNYGCAKGQTQPQITATFPAIPGILATAQTVGPKSRCYAAISNGVGNLLSGGISGITSQSVQSAINGINNLDTNAPPINASAGTVAGNSDLINALTNSGLTQDQATKIASDPASAQALINAYATGDAGTVQQTIVSAASKANLDYDQIYNNISNLSASQVQSAQSTLAPLADSSGTTITGSDTFNSASATPPATNTSNISSALSPLCNQLGGCGNVCPNSNSMVCNTNNPGALTWASWESNYGGMPCGQANNTTCFPTMEQGIEAQARLLTTSNSYFASGNNTIWGEFCGSNYASGPGSNCSAYATFVSNQTGIPMNQTIDPNNAQQIGSIMMAQSRMESGQGVIFTTDQLQTGLGLAYGTQSLPSGTPGYTPTTSYLAANQVSSPFVITSGLGAGTGNVAGGSPFANMSPIYTASSLAAAPPAYVSTASNPVTYPTAVATQPAVNTAVPTASVPGNPVAQIIAQPQTVQPDGSITVAWSSVGMSSCGVFENNGSTPISQTIAGSQIIPTTTSGTIEFTLQCVAQSTGQTITEESAPVMVE